MRLEEFLKSKPLFYNKIDYDRFPNIYKKIEHKFTLPKVVHIVGTNGKGSTGRALAHMLHVKGLHVGHYSSPHITKFNERIWIDGADIDDNLLESIHQKLLNILKKEDAKALSYFEYTTLLAILVFSQICDYIVLEAGLGGEFDATNVFKKQLSIVTPIGYDHQSFLGSTIKEIATTKLRSVSGNLVLAKQYNKEVYELSHKRVEEVSSNLYLAESYLSDEFYDKLNDFIKYNNYPHFFKDNFSTAFCAFQLLGFDLDISLLNNLKLYGRCQKISSNITIDVGHNPMAATVLVEHFREKKVILVYNSYNDKEYESILEILKPIIKEVNILEIEDSRKVVQSNLEKVLKSKNIPFSNFEQIRNSEEYLVFGSFSVVERFVKKCQ